MDICEFEASEQFEAYQEHKVTHKSKSLDKSLDQKSFHEYPCEKCSYKAIHKKDLRRHMSQMHCSNESPEINACNTCDYSTQYKDSLRIHIEEEHGQTQYGQQSRYFYSSSRSKKSEQNRNNGKSFSDEPLKCNSCDLKAKTQKTQKPAHEEK